MKEFNINSSYAPYISLAMKKIGVTDYSIEYDGERCVVRADLSKRLYRALLRNAWAAKVTDEKSLRYLTREDVTNTMSGVIPASESLYFQKAWL